MKTEKHGNESVQETTGEVPRKKAKKEKKVVGQETKEMSKKVKETENSSKTEGEKPLESKSESTCNSLEITAFLTKNQIKITKANKEYPINPHFSFEKPLPKMLRKALKEFKAPTFIQSCSWPIILAKNDLVGVASTGIF